MDEDDLLAELEELEQEELDEALLVVQPTPAADGLPDVPRAEPVAAKPKPVAAAADDDMAELEAWAAS